MQQILLTEAKEGGVDHMSRIIDPVFPVHRPRAKALQAALVVGWFTQLYNVVSIWAGLSIAVVVWVVGVGTSPPVEEGKKLKIAHVGHKTVKYGSVLVR